MGPLDQYRYLTDARHRLLDHIRALTPEQYGQSFPFGLGSVRRTAHHMAGAEWYLIGQLAGGPSGDYPFASQRCPDFASLDRAWREQEPRTVETLAAERDWDRALEFTVTVPSKQVYRVKASSLEVFTQVCFHEVHHRSQVMAMLRQMGVPVETLDFLLLACEVTERV
ncbi:MAG: hypothetical protein A2Z07_06835 [Armatimonadetes bacterium RBG_16_67_12]|nr:MAG: hypothetical protein A2Z07_06835 [Armatimonadetes bacterium RBG_16_67_12]